MSDAKPNYCDPRVLARVARLELRARLIVEGFISGLHRSPYHGFSVEFAEHREYVPGDDIKHIDWKVWGRNDRFYLKQYEEETNLRCHLLLDCSKSMAYRGDDATAMSKFDYGATLCAAFALLLQRQQDAAGLLLFDRAVRTNLPPSAHPRQRQVLVHELEACTPDDRSDVADVFRRLPAQLHQRAVVVLISDLFLDLATLEAMLRQFRHRRHEVVLMHLLHEDEVTFPFTDNTLFRGLEDGVELMAEAPALRRSYLEALDDYRRACRRLCAHNQVDYVFLHTGMHLDAALTAYLASRHAHGSGRRNVRPATGGGDR